MKIKIVTGYDGTCEWRDLLEANLREYCDRWGYDLVMKFDGWEPSEHKKAWRKIELLRQEWDTDYDWIIWLDADCYFLNMTIPITRYLDESFDLGVTGPFQSGVEDCRDCPRQRDLTYSAGILFIRNCSWSEETLEEWWKARDETWSPDYCRHHLMDTTYLTCNLMQQPTTAEKIRIFPLTEIGWATLSGLDNQFILHCYGSPGPERVKRFQFYGGYVIR